MKRIDEYKLMSHKVFGGELYVINSEAGKAECRYMDNNGQMHRETFLLDELTDYVEPAKSVVIGKSIPRAGEAKK